MSALTEEAFRELLDERGILREGALPSPPRARAYSVFAQRPDVYLDVPTLARQAERFFATKLGVTVDKGYDDSPPTTDAARIVVAGPDGSASGTRVCFGRMADGADVAAAEEAERRQGTTGLALLAQRCPTLWLVVTETENDKVALAIAAIFASSMLGPILAPDGNTVFGVRTARLLLEGQPAPYR